MPINYIVIKSRVYRQQPTSSGSDSSIGAIERSTRNNHDSRSERDMGVS